MSEHEKEKKAAVTSAVAVAAAASLIAGSLMDSPRELLEGEGASPEPIVRDLAEWDDGVDDEDLDEEESQDEEDRKRGGLRSLMRARILRLPLAVRLLFVLPAWAVGSLLLTGGSALFSALAPAAGQVLGAILMAAVLFGAFLLAAKAVFPDLPLKKILNRRTVPALCIAGVLLAALDALLPLVWADYAGWRNALRAIALLAVLTALVIAFARREGKRRRALAAGKAEAKRRREEGRFIATDEAGTYEIPIRWPVKSK